MARVKKERELKRSRITVIGEGQTERWYFEHLRSVMGYRYDCKPRFFSRQSFDEMRKLIEWVLQNGGIAVCICDVDVTRTNSAERRRFNDMKDYYASNEKVFICESMPSIEFWFLLHYFETSKHFHDSAEVANALRKYLPSFQKNGDFLEKIQRVEELCADNKLKKACLRAHSLSHNGQVESYSNVFKAIELFSQERQ